MTPNFSSGVSHFPSIKLRHSTIFGLVLEEDIRSLSFFLGFAEQKEYAYYP
jgi:hypothetical protein